MGFYKTAVAFGAGYTLGQPDGRAQLGRYLRQARELAQRPEARRLRERGWDLAGEQIASIKRQLDARSRTAALDPATADHDGSRDRHGWGRRGWRRSPAATDDAGAGVVAADVMPDAHEVPSTDPAAAPTSPIPGTDPSTAGFGGTTVVDDSRAALGFPTLSPPEGPARRARHRTRRDHPGVHSARCSPPRMTPIVWKPK